MVALFNLIPFLFVILMGLIGWKVVKTTGKRIALTVFTALVLIVYSQVQPSYGPKGVVARTELPAFEDRKIEPIDRLLRPKSGDFYDKLRADAYKNIELKAAQAREDGKNE